MSKSKGSNAGRKQKPSRTDSPPENGPIKTVAQLVKAHLEFATSRVMPTSFIVRKNILGQFALAYGKRELTSLKPIDLYEWIASKQGWSDTTKHNGVRNVKLLFNWAMDMELMERNPFRKVHHRPGPPRQAMTRAQFQSLLRSSNTCTLLVWETRPTSAARFKQFLLFMWQTGCRTSEARELRWSNIEWKHSRAVLHQHKTCRTLRNPRPRIIHLDSVAMRLLLRIRSYNQPGDFVFVTVHGRQWSRRAIHVRMKRIRAAAGLSMDVKLYCARHAFGTRGLENGLDLKTVSLLMGHASVQMTERYTHLADNLPHMADAIERLNGNRPGPVASEDVPTEPSRVRKSRKPSSESGANAHWGTTSFDVGG